MAIGFLCSRMAVRSNLISTLLLIQQLSRKRGGMRELRLCRRTLVPTPTTKGRQWGGRCFTCELPSRTLRQKKGGIGRAAVLPANSHADPRKKKRAAWGGCGFACEPPCRAQNKENKNKKKGRKLKDRITPHVYVFARGLESSLM